MNLDVADTKSALYLPAGAAPTKLTSTRWIGGPSVMLATLGARARRRHRWNYRFGT